MHHETGVLEILIVFSLILYLGVKRGEDNQSIRGICYKVVNFLNVIKRWQTDWLICLQNSSCSSKHRSRWGGQATVSSIFPGKKSETMPASAKLFLAGVMDVGLTQQSRHCFSPCCLSDVKPTHPKIKEATLPLPAPLGLHNEWSLDQVD